MTEELVRNTVIPPWMESISLQQQSVILLALRGPDGVRKHHPAKIVHCAYRGTILRAAERGRFLHWGEEADTFMSMGDIADPERWNHAIRQFFHHVDELPHHYVAHLAHAAQIIGYCHPVHEVASAWKRFYERWCDDLHVTPETHEQMNERLGDWGQAKSRLARLGYDFPLPPPRESKPLDLNDIPF